jgi:hypothetical protein
MPDEDIKRHDNAPEPSCETILYRRSFPKNGIDGSMKPPSGTTPKKALSFISGAQMHVQNLVPVKRCYIAGQGLL